MIEMQAATETVVSWAVGNSDPANLTLLAVVYYKLRENHNDLQAELKKLESRVEDLHQVQNGDR